MTAEKIFFDTKRERLIWMAGAFKNNIKLTSKLHKKERTEREAEIQKL